MDDFSFNFVRVLSGLLISSALLVVFYVFVIQNYISFDLTGHSMVQSRSGVYDRGFTLAEVTGENIQGRIFTPAHIVMFPAVDSHVRFESTSPNMRNLRIYNQMRLSHNQPIPFANTTVWDRRYYMSLQSANNRALTFRSFNNAGEFGNGFFSWQTLTETARVPGDMLPQNLAHPRGGWFGVINGADNGTTDWLFFSVEQSDRLLIPLFPEIASPPVADITIFD